jgi:hypothetical protein
MARGGGGSTGQGEGAPPSRRGGGGGHRGGEKGGERERVREGLGCDMWWETKKNLENNGDSSMEKRRSSLEPRRKSPIDGEPEVGSTNQKYRDEALDETNATVLSDSANDAQIESNCSPDLEPPWTSASNSENCGSNMGNCFEIWKGLGERIPAIYIYIYISRVWSYFIFSNKFIFKI